MITDTSIQPRRIAGEALRFMVWALLRPIRAVCLRRWANIAALSVVGLVFVMVIELTFGRQIRRLAGLWAGVPMVAVALISLVFLAIACVPLAHLGGLHWRQLKRTAVYPPVWLAALLTLGAMFQLERSDPALPFPEFSGETWLWAIGICLFAPVICLVGGAVLKSSTPVRRPRKLRDGETTEERSLRTLTADPKNLLIPWLEQEQPVENPESDDFFDLRYVAQRIGERLFDVKLATIGLVGPFGVGKSSIVKFVKHYVELDRAFRTRMQARWFEECRRRRVMERFAPRILLCPVSAWGLRDQPGAAVILRHAVDRLAVEVDCLSVSNLPEQYLQTLKGVSPEWLNLPLMLAMPDDAEEQLRRLEPILEAINARLIIVVEDLDRNVEAPVVAVFSQAFDSQGENSSTDGSSRFTSQASGRIARELEALFSRLLDLERVSFILVVANPGAADISRLCERIEPVYRVERTLAVNVIGALRAHCLNLLREQGDIQPAYESTLGFMGALHEANALDYDELKGKTPVSALAELLTTPRVLKQALRHALQAWTDLHGEVDFDDLLICHVIRSVSPNAFDFMMEHYGELSAATSDGKNKNELTSAWGAEVRDCSLHVRELLWTLIGFLSPGVAAVSRSPRPPQGVAGTVYWGRVVRGRIAEPVRDQQVLRAIVAWKNNRADTFLANKLATEQAFADALERVTQGDPRRELGLAHDELRLLTT